MQQRPHTGTPLVRQLDDVIPEEQAGFEHKVLFSPATVGSSFMKFAVVHGKPGARSGARAHPGGEMALTLQGRAQFTATGTRYDLGPGTAIALPPAVEYSAEVVGDEEWIAVTASCDECPLMRAEREQATLAAAPQSLAAEVPLMRRLDEVIPDQLYGFERRVLFSPSTVGSRYIKFAKVHGKPGAKSVPHTHPGGEMALTLHGNAQLTIDGERYDLTGGTAIAVPPAVRHPAEAVGSDEWIVVTSYCDECPLMRKKLVEERKAP